LYNIINNRLNSTQGRYRYTTCRAFSEFRKIPVLQNPQSIPNSWIGKTSPGLEIVLMQSLISSLSDETIAGNGFFKKMIAMTPPRLREARGFIPCIAFFLFHGWLAA